MKRKNMSNNNDFDDIENEIDENDFVDEKFDFVSAAPSPKIEEPKKETLKKKKIEEKETQKNFPFKSSNNSNSDSKPIRSPTSSNSEKTMAELTKKVKEVNKGLETLDFNIEKLNRFSNNLKIFKIWNTVILSIAALTTGAILTFAIQSSMMINQNNEEIIKILDEFNVQIAKDEKGELQLFTKKEKSKTFTTSEYQVLQIQKQK
jgi:hypothetical protein